MARRPKNVLRIWYTDANGLKHEVLRLLIAQGKNGELLLTRLPFEAEVDLGQCQNNERLGVFYAARQILNLGDRRLLEAFPNAQVAIVGRGENYIQAEVDLGQLDEADIKKLEALASKPADKPKNAKPGDQPPAPVKQDDWAVLAYADGKPVQRIVAGKLESQQQPSLPGMPAQSSGVDVYQLGRNYMAAHSGKSPLLTSPAAQELFSELRELAYEIDVKTEAAKEEAKADQSFMQKLTAWATGQGAQSAPTPALQRLKAQFENVYLAFAQCEPGQTTNIQSSVGDARLDQWIKDEKPAAAGVAPKRKADKVYTLQKDGAVDGKAAVETARSETEEGVFEALETFDKARVEYVKFLTEHGQPESELDGISSTSVFDPQRATLYGDQREALQQQSRRLRREFDERIGTHSERTRQVLARRGYEQYLRDLRNKSFALKPPSGQDNRSIEERMSSPQPTPDDIRQAVLQEIADLVSPLTPDTQKYAPEQITATRQLLGRVLAADKAYRAAKTVADAARTKASEFNDNAATAIVANGVCDSIDRLVAEKLALAQRACTAALDVDGVDATELQGFADNLRAAAADGDAAFVDAADGNAAADDDAADDDGNAAAAAVDGNAADFVDTPNADLAAQAVRAVADAAQAVADAAAAQAARANADAAQAARANAAAAQAVAEHRDDSSSVSLRGVREAAQAANAIADATAEAAQAANAIADATAEAAQAANAIAVRLEGTSARATNEPAAVKSATDAPVDLEDMSRFLRDDFCMAAFDRERQVRQRDGLYSRFLEAQSRKDPQWVDAVYKMPRSEAFGAVQSAYQAWQFSRPLWEVHAALERHLTDRDVLVEEVKAHFSEKGSVLPESFVDFQDPDWIKAMAAKTVDAAAPELSKAFLNWQRDHLLPHLRDRESKRPTSQVYSQFREQNYQALWEEGQRLKENARAAKAELDGFREENAVILGSDYAVSESPLSAQKRVKHEGLVEADEKAQKELREFVECRQYMALESAGKSLLQEKESKLWYLDATGVTDEQLVRAQFNDDVLLGKSSPLALVSQMDDCLASLKEADQKVRQREDNILNDEDTTRKVLDEAKERRLKKHREDTNNEEIAKRWGEAGPMGRIVQSATEINRGEGHIATTIKSLWRSAAQSTGADSYANVASAFFALLLLSLFVGFLGIAKLASTSRYRKDREAIEDVVNQSLLDNADNKDFDLDLNQFDESLRNAKLGVDSPFGQIRSDNPQERTKAYINEAKYYAAAYALERGVKKERIKGIEKLPEFHQKCLNDIVHRGPDKALNTASARWHNAANWLFSCNRLFGSAISSSPADNKPVQTPKTQRTGVVSSGARGSCAGDLGSSSHDAGTSSQPRAVR